MDSGREKPHDELTIGEGFREVLPPLAEGEIEGASFLISQLAKAVRNHAIYPADNRICIEFLDRVHDNFASFLAEHREFQLHVQEHTFTYRGRVAHQEEDLRKSLPMRLFRDGVRKLVFYEGFERKELLSLVEVLDTVSKADDLDDDAVTLLWEKDFANLSYFVIEDPFEEEEQAPDLGHSLGKQEDEVPQEGQAYVPPKLSPRTIASVLTITDHDIRTARQLIAQEHARNLHHDLTTLLFEMLTLRRGDEVSFQQTVELLSRICGIYVKSERLGEAAEILRKFREALDLELTVTQRGLILAEFEANRSPEVMRHIERLFEHSTPRQPKDVAEFLRLLGPEIVPQLMQMISSAANPKILVQVMFELNEKSADLLIKKLRDPDPEVVRRMVEILGSLQDPEFVPPLLEELDHPVMAVRLAAIRAIAGTSGAAARDGLIAALTNSAFQVRVQALKGLEKRPDPMVLPLLVDLVETAEFSKRGAPEQQEFLFAIARIGEEGSVEVLARLLGRAGRFSGLRTRRLAQSAAAALGRIHCVRARDALQSGGKPRAVREACQVALGNQNIGNSGEEEE